MKDKIIKLSDVIETLIAMDYLKSKEVLSAIPAADNGSCQICGRSFLHCVCADNELLESLDMINEANS